jgi:drug/metabolite transporter (DMT)-like permease
MSKRTWALFAATLVSIIYGVTFTIAKDVMPKYVQPFGFITMRVGGSVLLFWLISFFGPKEKIAKETKDREEAFKYMNENGEDQLLIDDFV